MRRALKLLGAVVALAVAVLLAQVTSAAIDAGVWWLAVAAVVGMWVVLAVAAQLTWSALRHGGAR